MYKISYPYALPRLFWTTTPNGISNKSFTAYPPPHCLLFPSCYVNISDIRNETNKKGLNLQFTFATYSSIISHGYGNNPGCPPTFFLLNKLGHAKHMLIALKICVSSGLVTQNQPGCGQLPQVKTLCISGKREVSCNLPKHEFPKQSYNWLKIMFSKKYAQRRERRG